MNIVVQTPRKADSPAPTNDADALLMPDHLGFLQALTLASREMHPDAKSGVFLVSLDCIDRIDGMLGYRAGDAVCTQVAASLKQALKQGDSIYRVGRNELVCLLRNLPGDAHITLAAYKILRIMDSLPRVDGTSLYATPFIGIAMGSRGNADADELLRQANVAMHEAKRRADRFAVYDASLEASRVMQFQMQSELRGAITENALEVYFQPKLDLRSGLIVGVESLSRWNHPTRGAIPPNKFVSVAEASGFISDLTVRVMNSALCHYDALSANTSHLHMAVNLSPKDLRENNLPELVHQMLSIWNVPADSLTLELTETAVMEDDANYGEALVRLKETGIRLSIDDFGTGYSSMTRLRHLPVDELKLDMSFVKSMLISSSDEAIVYSMIKLAHDLGLSVVAEGVEDLATLQRLKEFECDIVQGYYVSQPLAPQAAIDFLSGWKARAD